MRTPPRSWVRWWLEDSDLTPQDDEIYVRKTAREKQMAFHVLGTYEPISLGLLAIRCNSENGIITPLSICIADQVEFPERRGMDMKLLARAQGDGDDGA